MTSVMLYSGGLDSYCTAALTRPDVLLAVDTGTRYGDVEIARMQAPAGLEARLQYVALRGLSTWERSSDLILPGRNAHLILAAANYGDTIYLGATAGDRVEDKNQPFADLMNTLLAHLYQPQWWLPEGRNVRVELPVKHLTKTEIVAAYLAAGGDREAVVTDTFSCYYPVDKQPCRSCKPCVRRFVALLLNGLTPDVDCSDALAQWRSQALHPSWDRGDAERDEILKAHMILHSS